MHRFFSIVLLFPILFVATLVLTFTSYNARSINEMQEIMIRDAADAANDAAVEEAQRIAHVDIYGKTTLDPESVWEEYKRTFLRALNLFSDKNMELFEGYCPATIIAVNDGYFMRLRTVDEDGEIVVRFSQKIPYARETKSGSIVADTMNGSYIYGRQGGEIRVWGDDAPIESEEGGIHDTAAIGLELMRAMDYCIEIENAAVTNPIWDTQKFYVPKELIDTVYYDAVSFKGLSVLNLIQGFDMKGSKPVDYFTISNTQLVNANRFACYVADNGKKYYSLLHEDNTILEANPDTAENIVSTKIEAAKLGYSPDPRYYRLPSI